MTCPGGDGRMVWVVALNFCVNCLLLAGSCRMAGRSAAPERMFCAGLLGAAYAAGCLTPGFRFLGALHWWLTSLALMSVIAFGTGKSGWKAGGIFALLTMALGGMAMAVGHGGGWATPLCAVGVRLLGQFSLGGRQERRLLPVEISGGGKTVRLTALQDTGNELRDPVTGERVLVIGGASAQQLTGLTAQQLRKPLETLMCAPVPGLRLIPFHSVGVENGLLLAMRFPRVRIGDRERPGIVAFAPQQLGGEEYQALAGGIL